MRKRIIPDADTAFRIGLVKTATMPHASMKVFSYPHPNSNLTLFAVEIVAHDGKTEIIATQ